MGFDNLHIFFDRAGIPHKDGFAFDSAAGDVVYIDGNGNSLPAVLHKIDNQTASRENRGATASVFGFVKCKRASGLIV